MVPDATEYSSDAVVVIFGSIVVREKGIDSFLTLEPVEDDYVAQIGVGGHVVFNRTHSKLVKATLRILQTSESNQALSDHRVADLKVPNGGFASFTVRDKLGNDLHQGSKAKIVRPPNAEYARQVGENEWTFLIADMDLYFGGH